MKNETKHPLDNLLEIAEILDSKKDKSLTSKDLEELKKKLPKGDNDPNIENELKKKSLVNKIFDKLKGFFRC